MQLTTLTSTNTNLDSTFVDFSIKQTPLMFDILSNKLYSNPILAIVRELLTNAYDAQVVNGNPDTPIFVQIPSYLSEDFIIRDYGTGLSKQDMVELYTTFFDSTKSSDNTLTGGFGLGSKTPFAYTDSFIVHSYFEQEKTSYVVFKNDGMPTLTEIGSEPTDESNGLEICISVDSKDHAEFKRCLCLFHKFNREVVLKDFEIYDSILTKDNLSILPIEDTLASICFKQGQNVFSVPFDVLKHTQKLQDLHDTIDDANAVCVIEVPIGTLTISPNRESFQINRDIIEQLATYIESLNDDIYNLMLSAEEGSFLYDKLHKLKVKKHIPYPELAVYSHVIEVLATRTFDFCTAYKGLHGFATLDLSQEVEFRALSYNTHTPLSIAVGRKTILIIDREGKITRNTLRTLTSKLCLYHNTAVEVFVPNLNCLCVTYGDKPYYTYHVKDTNNTSKFIKDYYKLFKSLKEHMGYDVELVTYKSLQKRVQTVKNKKTTADITVQQEKRVRVAYVWPGPQYCTPDSTLFSLNGFRNSDKLVDVVVPIAKGKDYKTYIAEWVKTNIKWFYAHKGHPSNSLDTYVRKQYDIGNDAEIRLISVAPSVIKTVKKYTNAIVLDEQDYLNSLGDATPLPYNVVKAISVSKTLESRINYLFGKSRYKHLILRLPEIKSLLSYANRDLSNTYTSYETRNIRTKHYLFSRPHIERIIDALYILYEDKFTVAELRSSYSDTRRALTKLKQILQEMVHENYS